MLIFSKYLFFPRFHALAIWPFIILKSRNLQYDKVIINHEKIHLRQQIELLWLLYFVWYLVEFIIHWIRLGDFMKAYYAISFEKEAYKHEGDPEYLRKRKFWQFLKFF